MILDALTLYINLYKPIFINCGVKAIEVDRNAPYSLHLDARGC